MKRNRRHVCVCVSEIIMFEKHSIWRMKPRNEIKGIYQMHVRYCVWLIENTGMYGRTDKCLYVYFQNGRKGNKYRELKIVVIWWLFAVLRSFSFARAYSHCEQKWKKMRDKFGKSDFLHSQCNFYPNSCLYYTQKKCNFSVQNWAQKTESCWTILSKLAYLLKQFTEM